MFNYIWRKATIVKSLLVFLLGLLLFLNTSGTSVDPLGAVGGDGSNETRLGQLADSNAGEGSIDAETVDQNGGRNQLVGGDFLHKLVIGGLVEDDGVVGLVLDLSLGPFLRRGAIGMLELL